MLKPTFPGGESAMLQWVANRVNYPDYAKNNNIQGKVFIQFIINKEGIVEDVTILRGVHPVLNDEAIRVVKTFPKWKPGEVCGKNVKVSFQIPINFKLY
jgi:protein TonB